MHRVASGPRRVGCCIPATSRLAGCLALFAFMGSTAGAQKLQVETFAVGDGLPSAEIYDLAQDPSGRLWVLTRAGFAVYDGRELDDRVVEGLPRDQLAVVELDADGRPWTVTGVKRRVYYREGPAWRHLPGPPAPPSLSPGTYATSLAVGAHRRLPVIVGTTTLGLQLWNGEGWAYHGSAQGLPSDGVTVLAGTMGRLLEELLELSRIGRLMNEPETVDLGELAREAADSVAGPIAERGVTVEIDPDLPVVHGDRVRLAEVLQNLVENAAKFMGEEPAPRIEIGARREGAETVVVVRDNGIGIDPRYQDKVLFERLDQSIGGTGVGLTLVQRIVEVHGGRIWIESEGAGRGTAFCFTLPKAAGSAAPPGSLPWLRAPSG